MYFSNIFKQIHDYCVAAAIKNKNIHSNKISSRDWICIPQDKVSLMLYSPLFSHQYDFLELIVFWREKVEYAEMLGNDKHHGQGDEVSSKAKSTFSAGFDRSHKTYRSPKDRICHCQKKGVLNHVPVSKSCLMNPKSACH